MHIKNHNSADKQIYDISSRLTAIAEILQGRNKL